MTQIASDAFAGTAGTTLQSYSSSWTKHSTSPIGAVLSDANRARGDGSGAAFYYHSVTPTNADYSVNLDVYEVSDTGNYAAGAAGRIDTAAVTMYLARYGDITTDSVQLYKAVAGTFTQLGSNVSDEITTGTSANIKLDMSGSTIAAYSRGGGSPTISVTDTSITAKGKAGFRIGFGGSATASDTVAYHIDNFSVDETSSGVTGTLTSTLDSFTSNLSGTTTIVGSINNTFSSFTSSITGFSTIVGQIAYTNQDVTSNITGTTAVMGQIAVTNQNSTSNITGDVGGNITGTIASTLQNSTSSIQGTTQITGTMSVIMGSFTSVIQGTTTILGTISKTMDDFISSISGFIGEAKARLLSLLGVGS